MNPDEILNGAKTAFIDQHSNSSLDFRPRLIYNDSRNKVVNSIIDELRGCDEFIMSSAFITESGLMYLLEDFRRLEQNNIKGRILYSQENEGFHTKGYVFTKDNVSKAIVGSSNLTMNALTVNKEWNVEFTSLEEGEMLSSIKREFSQLWDAADSLEEALPAYEKIYNDNKNFRHIRELTDELKEKEIKDLTPNVMQEDFLKNLRDLIKRGENRAILVSATGTGKTYASAFAVKDFSPKRFLFLVHREQIAKQSIDAYRNVFKDPEKFGLVSGNSKQFDKDYVFATIQTMSKEEIHKRYAEDHFDYIIIDEVHKAGALSYQKIFR